MVGIIVGFTDGTLLGDKEGILDGIFVGIPDGD